MGKAERHARDWQPTTLDALLAAEAFYCHTCNIMGNPKHFSPLRDTCNATKLTLQRKILEICFDIDKANSIRVNNDRNRYLARKGFQQQALDKYREVRLMLEIIKKQFKVHKDKYWPWIDYYIDGEKKLQAWMKSDEERYGKIGQAQS